MQTTIKNIFGENLDILVEGKAQSKDVIFFISEHYNVRIRLRTRGNGKIHV